LPAISDIIHFPELFQGLKCKQKNSRTFKKPSKKTKKQVLTNTVSNKNQSTQHIPLFTYLFLFIIYRCATEE